MLFIEHLLADELLTQITVLLPKLVNFGRIQGLTLFTVQHQGCLLYAPDAPDTPDARDALDTLDALEDLEALDVSDALSRTSLVTHIKEMRVHIQN